MTSPLPTHDPFVQILLILLADIFLNLFVHRGKYAKSIFFFLDVIASLTMIPALLPLFGVHALTGAASLSVARLGRVAKASARCVFLSYGQGFCSESGGTGSAYVALSSFPPVFPPTIWHA